MAAASTLEAVRLAMAITSTAYDNELSDLIDAALMDMKTNGIDVCGKQDDPLVLQAVKTYCRAHFQSPADHDRLVTAYEAQKGHMQICTGYTTWTGVT